MQQKAYTTKKETVRLKSSDTLRFSIIPPQLLLLLHIIPCTIFIMYYVSDHITKKGVGRLTIPIVNSRKHFFCVKYVLSDTLNKKHLMMIGTLNSYLFTIIVVFRLYDVIYFLEV